MPVNAVCYSLSVVVKKNKEKSNVPANQCLKFEAIAFLLTDAYVMPKLLSIKVTKMKCHRKQKCNSYQHFFVRRRQSVKQAVPQYCEDIQTHVLVLNSICGSVSAKGEI